MPAVLAGYLVTRRARFAGNALPFYGKSAFRAILTVLRQHGVQPQGTPYIKKQEKQS